MTYDALEFLTELFQKQPRSGDVELKFVKGVITEKELSPEWFLIWDERAAIMEYDGGLPRERAEAEALKEVVNLMKSRSDKSTTDHDIQEQ